MSPAIPLVGPTNRQFSRTASATRTINWCQESVQDSSAKTRSYLRPTSCYRPFVQFGEGPSTALFSQNGRCFGICGTTFAEIFDNGLVTTYTPAVEYDPTYRATICSNGTAGNQLFITSGGLGYIFDLGANTLTPITAPGFPANALMGEFMDGYFIVLIKDTRRFQISALEDGTSWDSLDVAERSIAADNIVFIRRNHRELFLIGTQTSEAWYDSGDALFPFQPIQGVLIESGAIASFSSQRLGDSVIWVDQDERGGGTVRKLDGYTPSKLSTFAIDFDLASNIANLSASVGVAWSEQGHLFYGLWTPDARTMPVLDLAENAWHERAVWDSTACRYDADVFTTHCYFNGRHLVGDARVGAVYELSTEFPTSQIVGA